MGGGGVSQHALQVVSQHALQQVLEGGACSGGVCGGDPPGQQTATVADGTHPTGMHSCLINFYMKLMD